MVLWSLAGSDASIAAATDDTAKLEEGRPAGELVLWSWAGTTAVVAAADSVK